MTRAYLGRPPYGFAHRGGAGCFPENTLLAFGEAHALGFTHIETDVHMTRDGHVVCFHDATLDRTTNGRGLIRHRSLAELRELDAGYRFTPDGGETYPYRGQGATIPTLEEALALAPDLRFNLEIKQRSPDMQRTLWRRIQELGAEDRVLVASAMNDVTRSFRRLSGGRVAASPGVAGILRFWLAVRAGVHRWMRFDFDALQVPVSHGSLRVVDERFIEAAHHHGIHVHVWTIDDPGRMHRLFEMGADAVMTDQPHVLANVLKTRRGAQAGEDRDRLSHRAPR